MERRSSLALWRYRKEQAAAAKEFSAFTWPQAMVLGQGERALSTALWADPSQPMALPKVDYVVLQRADATGLYPTMKSAPSPPMPSN